VWWLLLAAMVVAVGYPLWTLTLRYRRIIYTDAQAVPERPVALVFGAGYWPDGTPSDVMKDRVEAAIALYRAGRVQKVLFSGDNRFVNYNEPEKMREYALSLGLPDEAIALDYAGRRTYDTCYRARDIFGLRKVVLVTQRYHLPRALSGQLLEKSQNTAGILRPGRDPVAVTMTGKGPFRGLDTIAPIADKDDQQGLREK